MKKLVTAFMGLLLIVGLTSMVRMSPPYNAKMCKSDCEMLVSGGLFSSQGACMSACASCTNPSNSNAATGAICLCRLIDAYEGLENYDVNFGQCVNMVKGN